MPEPLIEPSHHLQMLAAYLFMVKGMEFLVVADQYSYYLVVYRSPLLSSAGVVTLNLHDIQSPLGADFSKGDSIHFPRDEGVHFTWGPGLPKDLRTSPPLEPEDGGGC